MCTTILIEGKTIESAGDLVKYLNLQVIPKEFWENGYEKFEAQDCCLCGIKIPELAKFMGVRYVRSGLYYHFGEYEIVLAQKNLTELL